MSWTQNMADVIREVIFQDEELKRLMMIPEGDQNNLSAFRDRYFIRGNPAGEIVGDEPVRIVYSEGEPSETSAPNIFKHRIEFSVYCQSKHCYDAAEDRTLHRGHLIGERLIQLLSGKRLCNIRFYARGLYDQTIRMAGFERVSAVFTYKRIYPA